MNALFLEASWHIRQFLSGQGLTIDFLSNLCYNEDMGKVYTTPVTLDLAKLNIDKLSLIYL